MWGLRWQAATLRTVSRQATRVGASKADDVGKGEKGLMCVGVRACGKGST